MIFSVSSRLTLLAILAILVISAVFVNKGALQDSPWDAPIYLMRGKEVAETHYLRDMALHAEGTAAKLPGYRAGEYTPYWYFMRFGNIMLIGAVVSIMGAGMASIQVAFWLYTLLMAASVVLGTLLCIRIIRTLDQTIPERMIVTGTLISAALYLASDAYRHLSGVLVAEIPALFLITGSALALVMSGFRRSISLAVLSGVLGFALYVVKIEGVWAYISFSMIYGLVFAIHSREKLWWPAILISGFSAFSLYMAYSWWLWPLTDPRLLPVFAKAFQLGSPNPVAPIKVFVATGGLLWLGFLFAFRYRMRSPAFWLAIGWFGLVSLPYLDNLINNRGATVIRNFAIIMPPLLLMSSLGWSALLEATMAKKASRLFLFPLACGIALLLALSHTETYHLLKQVPGGWRLQYIKEYLSPAPYERQSYQVGELAEISRFINSDGRPTILIRGKDVTEEHLTIVSYFGPPAKSSSIEQFDSTQNVDRCGANMSQSVLEPVTYCNTSPTAEALGKLTKAGTRIMVLRQRSGIAGSPHQPMDKFAYMTQNLVLLSDMNLGEK